MGEHAAGDPRCSRKLGSLIHVIVLCPATNDNGDDEDALLSFIMDDDDDDDDIVAVVDVDIVDSDDGGKGSISHAASVRPRSLPPKTSNAGNDSDDDE